MENKMTKKKIITLCVIAFVILGMLAGVLFYIFKPEAPIEVFSIKPQKTDVVEKFESSATVSSAKAGEFTLLEGVMPTKVNVKVGDIVKSGDVLVEFDSSSLSQTLNAKKADLDKARSAYNEYGRKTREASSKLATVEKQIADAQKNVDKLEKEVKSSKANTASSENTQAVDQLSSMTKDKSLAEKIVSAFSKNNSLSNLLSALDKVNSAGNVDLASMLSSSITDSAQAKLIEAQLSLASLKITKSLLESESKGSLDSVYKSVVDYCQKSYDNTRKQINSLNTGWVAEYDGIVSAVDVKAGEKFEKTSNQNGFDISSIINSITSGSADVTSLLSQFTSGTKTGLTVEYYPLEARFIIGQKDLANISLGQQVEIKTSGGNILNGEISYIAAKASSSSGLDFSSILGGATGGGSVTGVEARVKINSPTKDVIIGLDVDVSIEVNRHKDVLAVPVESIQYDNENAFVYGIKQQKKKFILFKQYIETGLFDGSNYEVVSGMDSNFNFVKSPTSSMEEGMRVGICIE